MKDGCRYLMERWHKDEAGEIDVHQIQTCTLKDGHDGDHVYGEWRDFHGRETGRVKITL